jgi:tetratricopeptide (TPR) repeat protein/DNA-binding CsgD family transcriptional regulator
MFFARPLLCIVVGMLVLSFASKGQVVPSMATVPLEEIARYRPDSAYLMLKQQLSLFQAKGNREGEAQIYRQMGQVLFRMGSYPQAVTQLLEADRLFRSLNKPEALAENSNILGSVYYYNKQSAESLERFQEALAFYHRTRNSSGLSDSYAHIGHWHEKQRQLDSALYYQRSALGFARLGRNRAAEARIYEHLGSIYEDLEAFDSARHYYEASLALYRSLGMRSEQVGLVNNLGDVFSKTGHPVEGLAYARDAMQLAWTEQDKYQLQSAYRDMGECFMAMGRPDSGYHYLEKSRDLVQEIYTADNQRQIALLQTLYAVEQKNAEIAQLNAGRQVDHIVLIAVILVALLLGLLGYAVNSRQKLKIRNEQALNEQQQRIHEAEKELMASDLRMKKMEEDTLKQELDIRSKELSSHILHLVQKNEVMEEIRTGLQEIIKDDRRDQKKQLRQLLNKIQMSVAQEDYWNEFRLIFDKVHASFFASLNRHSPDLTPAEVRLLALVKMNLGSADMSRLLGVTPDSLRVMRYRVKKKLRLGADDSLQQFIDQLG